MNTLSKISALVVASSLTACLQVHAAPVTFTESLNNINAEVQGTPYTGLFTDASLLSGSTVFNSSLYTITGATVDLTMLNAAGHVTTLTIDAIGQNMTPSTSPQTLAYILSGTQDSYIATKDGTFNFTVLADCELTAAKLILTTTANPPPQTSVPDAGSSALLLGGAISALAAIKRKLS